MKRLIVLLVPLTALAGLLYLGMKWRQEQQRAEEVRRAGAKAQMDTIAELRNRVADLSKTETGRIRVNPKDGLRYVYVAAGEFQMGCSPGDAGCLEPEKPQHPVQLRTGFWLGQTEVTQAAYEKVTKRNPSNLKGSDRPVEQVSWEEANAYCKDVGMRLPTEAEWEFAARAGSNEARYGNLAEVAWNAANSLRMTQPVAAKQPNAWGLYDMLGNAWEWTNDWYDGEYYKSSPPVDPAGPVKGDAKVMRGGAAGGNADGVRVSRRAKREPVYRLYDIGFRCAGELP